MSDELDYAEWVSKMPPAERIVLKREIFERLEAGDRAAFLDLDLKLDALAREMPRGDFERVILESAKAANNFHQIHVGAQSADVLRFLQVERLKLDAGDFDAAFADVAATLQTRGEFFAFFLPAALEKIKESFRDGGDFLAKIAWVEKHNALFTADLEKLAIILERGKENGQ